MNLLNNLSFMVLDTGIGGKVGKIIGGYIGPVFIVVVAVIGVLLAKEREFRKLAAFFGIAAIVGVLIFKGNDLFGGSGVFTKMVGNTVGAKGNNLEVNGVVIDENGGLGELKNNLIKDWIGPIYLLVVAVVGILIAKEREFRKLAAFLGIAALVGVLVFAGSQLFGNKGALSDTINSTLNTGGTTKTPKTPN